MAIEMKPRCIKMILPDGHTVDFLPDVLGEIIKWLQTEANMPEAGGFLVGYKDYRSGNISIDGLSHPYLLDVRSRCRFKIKDPKHKFFLFNAKARKSFYMGVWHTHPQAIPIPSSIDWKDWQETLMMDKTACKYVFFLIAGIESARVWVGDLTSKQIIEIAECEKEGDLYKEVK